MSKGKRSLPALLLALLLCGCGAAAPAPAETPEPTIAAVETPEPEPKGASGLTPAERPGDRRLKERLRAAEPGDRIELGRYEQNAKKPSGGAEPITWIVLEKQGDRLLLLSENTLELRQFNEKNVMDDWEHSSVRAWLNDEFFTLAFSELERSVILETTISNGTNPYYAYEPAPDTVDRIYLLSVEELERYFPTEEERIAYASEHVRKYRTSYADGRSWWWTRSPGVRPGDISYVNVGGVFVHKHLSTYNYGIRPALWCSLSGG